MSRRWDRQHSCSRHRQNSGYRCTFHCRRHRCRSSRSGKVCRSSHSRRSPCGSSTSRRCSHRACCSRSHRPGQYSHARQSRRGTRSGHQHTCPDRTPRDMSAPCMKLRKILDSTCRHRICSSLAGCSSRGNQQLLSNLHPGNSGSRHTSRDGSGPGQSSH